MQMIKKYEGVAYRQSPEPGAPWIVSFVAEAEELLKWAGIPRRKEGNIGYQRVANESRILKAAEFFRTAVNNQSPTALVVGIHPVSNSGNRIINLVFKNDDEGSSIRHCVLTVDMSFEQETIKEKIQRLAEQINLRLEGEEGGEVEEEDAEVEEEEEEEEEEEDVGNELEIGRSLLKDFLEKLGDNQWVQDNMGTINDIAVPATIIDGQHRVLGAARCERNIPFSVCAIFDCTWPEQVFQFTVVNYTSKSIPDQFITANAALSLTKLELNALETRLVQADIKVIEYELMAVVNFNEESPFFNLVNITEKPDETKIGYKTMVRIAKQWYSGKHDAVKSILKTLYPDITGRGAISKKIERWKDGDWGDFFLTFWKVVKMKYENEKTAEGSSLWTARSNLLTTIVLYELQERFLINLMNQDEKYFEVKEPDNEKDFLMSTVKTRAEAVLEYIPSKFFITEWGTKSLSTGAGRELLQTAFREFVEKRGKYNYNASKLVKG
jgi:hypothetical protein